MSVLKESKVEAKGVSKAKKFSLLVNDNYELTFNSGAKEVFRYHNIVFSEVLKFGYVGRCNSLSNR